MDVVRRRKLAELAVQANGTEEETAALCNRRTPRMEGQEAVGWEEREREEEKESGKTKGGKRKKRKK